MRKLCLVLVLLIGAASVAAQQDRFSQLDDAIDRHKGDSEALKRDLAEADALVAQNPTAGRAYFIRARILDALDRDSEAIAEYRRAISLTPGIASDAHYNIGVILDDQGRIPEAMVEYQEALRLDPANDDAAYNLGMQSYLAERFDDALKYWSIAQRLTPNDFQTARKMVQVYNALGRYDDAARARAEVLRIRAEGKDSSAVKAENWVFDQILLPTGRIFAREWFVAGETIYTFEVADAAEKTIGSINFERAGDGFVLRVATGGGPTPPAPVSFTTRPAWSELRGMVRALAIKAFSIR